MQCSGLEGAAMGLPVVAGDAECVKQFTSIYGVVPYTFAVSEAALEHQLTELATNEEFYDQESRRVSGFVARYHDYGAVTGYYLELLDEFFGWREALGIGIELVLPMRPMVAST